MTAVRMMWSSSPSSLGRPSSPLNPHAQTNAPGSSSPITSPTPQHSSLKGIPLGLPGTLGTPSFQRRLSPQPNASSSTRRPRPTSKRSSSVPSAQIPGSPIGLDLFSAEGTTPVEGAMWKERFARRVKERERRQSARQRDLDQRRSMDSSDDMDDEEADRQAQEDDEEIFRRLMILQKRREEHQKMVSYEVETGGSDPLLPEFWEEELEAFEREERSLSGQLGRPPQHTPQRGQQQQQHAAHPAHTPLTAVDGDDLMTTPTRNRLFPGARPSPRLDQLDEEDEWAREAAEAERAEREAEEAEIAARLEQAYGLSIPVQGNPEDLDMDWDAFDAMDIE